MICTLYHTIYEYLQYVTFYTHTYYTICIEIVQYWQKSKFIIVKSQTLQLKPFILAFLSISVQFGQKSNCGSSCTVLSLVFPLSYQPNGGNLLSFSQHFHSFLFKGVFSTFVENCFIWYADFVKNFLEMFGT